VVISPIDLSLGQPYRLYRVANRVDASVQRSRGPILVQSPVPSVGRIPVHARRIVRLTAGRVSDSTLMQKAASESFPSG